MSNYAKMLGMLAFAIAMLLPATASAKDKGQTLYMFGFAASFNDSTVYITDIQAVPNARLTRKHNHLVDRNDYSYQLRNHLVQQSPDSHPTVVTFFAKNQKDATKKYDKIYRKYTAKAKGRYIVVFIKQEEFKYQPIAQEQE